MIAIQPNEILKILRNFVKPLKTAQISVQPCKTLGLQLPK